MKNLKKVICCILCAAMITSMSSCNSTPGEPDNTSSVSDQQTSETSSDDSNNSDSSEAEISVDSDDEEDWKKEPAYGQELNYHFDGGNCNSGPFMADELGFYEEAGLNVKGYNSNTYTEALGTNAAQLAVGHISTMLVPSTNGVDLTFVGGAHIGCKSLYVLGDSEYQSTEDLKGQKISAPNGIGASDYNILARFFDKDGINPLTDISLIQVENSACVTAMENGEIAGALFSDTYAYQMVQEGKLRQVRSLSDDDFISEPCCVIAMSSTFIEENPITAKKFAEAVKKAHVWMKENPTEAVQILLDNSKITGDFDMNVELWKQLNFSLTDEFTENGLRGIVDDYIKLGLITAIDNTDEVMEKAWTPIAPDQK